MWLAVGISGTDEHVYRALLRDPEIGVADCARTLDITPQRCTAAIRRLVAVGLLQDSRSGRPRPVDPRVALGALIRERQGELARLSGDVEQLATDFQHGRLRADPGLLIEVLDGADAIRTRLRDLLAGVEEDIVCLDAPPYVAGGDECQSLELAALRRGVRFRCLYAADSLNDVEKYGYVSGMVRAGEQARLVRVVPLKLFVFDRRVAILPLTESEAGGRFRAIVVQQSALTDALHTLFEVLWRHAPQWPGVNGGNGRLRGNGPAPTDEECVLLQRLVAGMTDEAIARQLGCSRRTLRRRIDALLDKLGAASRFQAGVLAAQRGWL